MVCAIHIVPYLGRLSGLSLSDSRIVSNVLEV
jgi:hypothetical protein